MPKKVYLISIFVWLVSGSLLQAQAPAWSVNPANFSSTMTVTAQVYLDGSGVNSGANLLGAFVGSELRGVAQPIEIGGTAYYFLTVYSNVASGEELRFEVWLESEEAIFPALEKPDFVKNTNLGGYPDGYAINISLDNDFPVSLLTIPDDTTLVSYAFSEIGLEDYLASQDNDPVTWTIHNGTHIAGTLLSGDTLQAEPINPSWTGTDSLLVIVTESGTPNNYADSQYVSFTIYANYAAPDFAAIPDQIVWAGEPGPTGDLDDYLAYTGPCLKYDREILPPIGNEPVPGWVQPNGPPGTMNLIVEVNYGGVALPGSTHLLAGFVNGVFAGFTTQQSQFGKDIFFLTLENIGTGEITFKFYDAERMHLHEKESGLSFVPNGSAGSFLDPHQIDFAPFLIDLLSDGSWSTTVLEQDWTGTQQVLFVAKDCSYPDKAASVYVDFIGMECLSGTKNWSGNGDDLNWSDPFNWDGGKVPTLCEDVVIPTGITVNIQNDYVAYAKSLLINGGALSIASNASLRITEGVTNTNTGTLVNDGTLLSGGDITNSGTADLSGDGQYTLDGDWTNSADFAAGTSKVTFGGSANSTVTSGGDAFHQVEMAKTDADLLLADDLAIDDLLDFTSTDNQMVLGAHTLTFSSAGSINGYYSGNFIVTDGDGEVRKSALGGTPFVFPVGFDGATYTPLTLAQAGTADEYGVRALENALEDGSSGTAFTEDVVDASWQVTESVAGGSDLTLTAQWAASDELTGFDRSDSGIAHHDGNGWDLTDNGTSAASGSDPYTQMRTGMDDVGTFAIGGDPLMNHLALNPKVFLQGPYSGGQMNDALRSQSLLPTSEPYDGLGFTHVGRGGGETVAASVFSTTGNDAIVDWVFLELRDAITPSTVVATQSALVQKDGDIVGLDGTSEVRFVGLADADHYLVVRHRNHLGVRSAGTLSLSQSGTSYDFTTSMGQASGSNPMADLSGAYGLWGGNANGNTNIRYSGPANDQNQLLNGCLSGNKGAVLFNQYDRCDLNMNGNIRYSGPANDQNFLLNTVLGGDKGKVIFQTL